MKAIVLIKFASLQTREGYSRLKRLDSVIESHMVYGRFDVVVIIQANKLEDIRHILLSEIQPIPGVIETMPCLILEDETKLEPGLPPPPIRQSA